MADRQPMNDVRSGTNGIAERARFDPTSDDIVQAIHN